MSNIFDTLRGAFEPSPWPKAALCAAILAAHPALAEEDERPFGTAGGWTVTAGFEDGSLAHCTAGRAIDGRAIRMRTAEGDWSFALEHPGTVTGFDIDGTPYPPDAAREDAFAVIALSPQGQEAVRNGRLASITLGDDRIGVPLNGTAAATLKMQDCQRLAGAAPGPVDLATPDTPPPQETGPLGPGCPSRSEAASTWDGDAVTLRLTYPPDAEAEPLQIFWVDPFGRLQPMPVRLDAETPELTLEGYAGQSFIARDADGTCHGGLLRAGPGAEYTIPGNR